MFKKYCPKCKNYSYSASNLGRWICPYCRLDLTKYPVRLPDSSKKAK